MWNSNRDNWLCCDAALRGSVLAVRYDMVAIETLAVADLSRLCAQETARYRRGQSYAEHYCLELFRRAVLRRDEDAWAGVYTQYAGAVARWLGAPAGAADDSIADVFARFWRAVDAAKFKRFGSLSAVLQYLKMCAHTARLDHGRVAQSTRREESLDDSKIVLVAGDDVSQMVTAHLDARDFWRAVQDVLDDQRERTVIYLSYVIGLSPREICARHEAEFPEVSDVYRLKRNALDRLRRSAEFTRFV